MKIDIDFEVWKALTIKRTSEDMTENDVIRGLLGLSPKSHAKSPTMESLSLLVDGVELPQGTLLRASYKGKMISAEIDKAKIHFNGRQFESLSAAAIEATGHSRNGWTFWEIKRPNSTRWVRATELRKK